MLLIGKKEILTTFDRAVYTRTMQALADAKIPFSARSTGTGSNNRNISRLGDFGERTAYNTQYQIFVKKDVYDKAVYLLRGGAGQAD